MMITNEKKNESIIVTRYGGPEVLQIIQSPMPTPGYGEVRIKVKAIGVALADSMRREGVYPGTPKTPFTPGYDIIGEIDAVGDGVSKSRLGTLVAAMTQGTGGYTRNICVQESEAIEVPSGVNVGEAVALVLNYVTAYQMLNRIVSIETNGRILIHGASGGVGTALLDLGRLYGLNMYGTASAHKHAALAEYGAKLIDYKQDDFVKVIGQEAPHGIDAVFDPIGQENWERSKQVLKAGGILVGYGFTSILEDQQPSQDKIQEVAGQWMQLSEPGSQSESVQTIAFSTTGAKQQKPDHFRTDLTELFDLLSRGKIKPLISRMFDFSEAGLAHELVKRQSAIGKIVLLSQEE
ncbi:medium chain dehydrogenase/reductase family protein [Paenibacillus sp. SI8]|uniref:medium chain dehydrogenase/reductase family protein n=1 Tax=unclassified Paenibacillus TaxID=185978 RepID=UPI00346509BE